MRREDEAIYGLMAPWIFIAGVCVLMFILVIVDAAFNLGLSN
jgi:hypothetical protein|tara:strand:- start:149 stop:274 length:126 start_codon:yes stop_codon:yes gene_type:complete